MNNCFRPSVIARDCWLRELVGMPCDVSVKRVLVVVVVVFNLATTVKEGMRGPL